MKRGLRVSAALLLLVFMVSCATVGPTPTLTPQQQAKQNISMWTNVYAAQYDDYLSMVAMPNLSAAQKQVLLKKKGLLAQFETALNVYIGIVDRGGTPTMAESAAVTNVMNQLTAVATN